mgnify:FL=1|jgi:hypothetical protein
MKRLFFRGERRFRAAELFFGDRPDFRVEDYVPYLELEVVLQDDGRFSVWGNLADDSELLRDTRPDRQGVMHLALHLADQVCEDDAEPPADDCS